MAENVRAERLYIRCDRPAPQLFDASGDISKSGSKLKTVS